MKHRICTCWAADEEAASNSNIESESKRTVVRNAVKSGNA